MSNDDNSPPPQDLVIDDEYVFPLERQHEVRADDPQDINDNPQFRADRNRHISAMWHSRRNSMHEQAQRRQTGGRTRRRKCKGKGKCKKTVKTRKCIRAHK